MTEAIAIGLVGIGKIARDQHIPSLAANPKFKLVATASRNASLDGVASFKTVQEMIAGAPGLRAVSFATPPQGRYALARAAIEAGLDVMLEKPPGATVMEVEALARRAKEKKTTLFASWHSREAAAVAPARAWLQDKRVRLARIDWKEDVRFWHPGQEWIWRPGGFGVFDPGINALSVATRVLPAALILEAASLAFPRNRAAPIKAELHFSHDGAASVEASFDFLQTGPQTWNIEIETDGGTLLLAEGGAKMSIDGAAQKCPAASEYARLYEHFAALIAASASDVDLTPLQHVADALMIGERVDVEDFHY